MRLTLNREPLNPGTVCKGLKGFTLVEILVVIIILALASSLVFVNVGKSISKKNTKAFAQQMISLCKKARRMALEEGVPIAFNISSSHRCCWIRDRAKSIGFPEKMSIEGEGLAQLNEDLHTIRFYPDGSSDGGELTLSMPTSPVYTFRVDRLTGLLTRVQEEG